MTTESDKLPVMTPQQIAQQARDAYVAECAERGVPVDPVMADETYWRALRKAQGLAYYSGD